ncbi:MAG TPA: hypothetical protein PLO50_11695 [Nitrospira sp.]|nr:hypothetical protein [Nitrospira sp.]
MNELWIFGGALVVWVAFVLCQSWSRKGRGSLESRYVLRNTADGEPRQSLLRPTRGARRGGAWRVGSRVVWFFAFLFF